MKKYLLNQLDLSNLPTGSGLFLIRNLKSDFVYIMVSSNIDKYVKNVLHNLSIGSERLPNELVDDYNSLGKSNFSLEIDEDLLGVNFDLLIKEKEYLIDINDNVYNIKKDVSGGGYEVRSQETYILDLNGKIVETFPSSKMAYEYLDVTPYYSSKNTPSVVKKKYRIVTKEFYDLNIDEIKTWPNYTDINKEIKKYYLESKVIIADINGKTIDFKDINELSAKLNKTTEAIRVVLRGKSKSNKYNIRYKNPKAKLKLKELKEIKNQKAGK